MRRKRINLWMLPGLCLVVALASQGSCDAPVMGGADPPPIDRGPGCGLVTCESAKANCGPIGDGCGNTIFCGDCAFPTTCGGGGVPSQCGGDKACVALTCAALSLSCGITGDGCGFGISCYPNGGNSCPTPGETCGGGGVNGVCGSPPPGSMNGCIPRTCAQLGYGCGMTSDGCGNQLDCDPPGGCPGGQSCGGSGIQFQCGTTPTPCVPVTTCPAGLNCGMIGNGCGGTVNCAMATPACPGAQTCGGGGMANVCGPPTCTKKTTADCGTKCGFIDDGCGGTVNCSAINPCTAPATCGGGGVANVCANPTCVPKTCAMLGANCGWAGDGCGNLICCGTLAAGVCSTTCPAGQLCGSLQPNQCGNNKAGSSGMCMPGVNTTITGKVVAPTDSAAGFGTPDPIYNATVFVPSGPIAAITTGATCDQCATSQPAIVSTTTAIDGTFTLTNPPTGSNVTIVIQLGKWRRVVTLATVTPCVNNPLTTAQTRFPRRQGEGSIYDNIPRFAIGTGNVDVMECVMRKMGIADSEFVNGATAGTVPTTGRVQLYRANYMPTRGNGGAVIDANTPSENLLWGTPATLNAYDAILFPCTGGRTDKTATAQQNLVDYANKGGRVFATHFSYVWLYNNTQLGSMTPMATSSWQSTATWVPDTDSDAGPNNGLIDLSFPKGINLAQWLGQTVPPTPLTTNGAMTTGSTNVPVASTATFPSAGTLIIDQEQIIYGSKNGGGTQFRTLTRGANGTTVAAHASGATVTLWAQIPVSVLRQDFSTPLSNAQRWMYVQNAAPGNGPDNYPIHYTFNTPVGLPAANQCGRVVFSDFHVENHSGSNGLTFPTECNAAAPLTPQEKLLEFMLFDLTSCVAPDLPTCTKKTCNNLGAMPYTCGNWGDGCGGTLDCGACTAPQTCGGTGVAGMCGNAMCVPRTCAMLGNVCGTYSDGCSGTLNCTCGAGSNCIAATGQCVAPCTALTCNQLGYGCGQWSNGCGGIVTCPNCMAPQTCGGGGTPGQCGGCVPLTCTQLSLSCGTTSNGCGGTMNCGTCTAPDTCGGGGTPGVCGTGGSICRPLTCAQQGLSCGTAADGCGNQIQCGNCTEPDTCGGGGVAGKCGNTGCTPFTCQSVPGGPDDCGLIGDGCGGTADCGMCVGGVMCGGGGVANHCGVIG